MKHHQSAIEVLKNSSFFYVITVDMNGRFSYVNQNYQRIFSFIAEDIVGKPYDITMHPDDTKICEEVSKKCFESPDKVFPATLRKHDAKGGYMATNWEYSAIFNEHSQPEGVFCIGYDITEYVNVSHQLETLKVDNEEKKVLIDQYRWDQSHVIRKPLANIMGLTNILNQLDADINIRNIAEMLSDSARQLDKAILDFYKDSK